MADKSGVYLIHFEVPYRHAQHYIGWAKDIGKRISHHKAGNGARLMAVITANTIAWELARTWPGATRELERQLKRRHGASKFCPVCRAT